MTLQCVVQCWGAEKATTKENLSCHYVNPSPINRNADNVGLFHHLLLYYYRRCNIVVIEEKAGTRIHAEEKK